MIEDQLLQIESEKKAMDVRRSTKSQVSKRLTKIQVVHRPQPHNQLRTDQSMGSPKSQNAASSREDFELKEPNLATEINSKYAGDSSKLVTPIKKKMETPQMEEVDSQSRRTIKLKSQSLYTSEDRRDEEDQKSKRTTGSVILQSLAEKRRKNGSKTGKVRQLQSNGDIVIITTRALQKRPKKVSNPEDDQLRRPVRVFKGGNHHKRRQSQQPFIAQLLQKAEMSRRNSQGDVTSGASPNYFDLRKRHSGSIPLKRSGLCESSLGIKVLDGPSVEKVFHIGSGRLLPEVKQQQNSTSATQAGWTSYHKQTTRRESVDTQAQSSTNFHLMPVTQVNSIVLQSSDSEQTGRFKTLQKGLYKAASTLNAEPAVKLSPFHQTARLDNSFRFNSTDRVTNARENLASTQESWRLTNDQKKILLQELISLDAQNQGQTDSFQPATQQNTNRSQTQTKHLATTQDFWKKVNRKVQKKNQRKFYSSMRPISNANGTISKVLGGSLETQGLLQHSINELKDQYDIQRRNSTGLSDFLIVEEKVGQEKSIEQGVLETEDSLFKSVLSTATQRRTNSLICYDKFASIQTASSHLGTVPDILNVRRESQFDRIKIKLEMLGQKGTVAKRDKRGVAQPIDASTFASLPQSNHNLQATIPLKLIQATTAKKQKKDVFDTKRSTTKPAQQKVKVGELADEGMSDRHSSEEKIINISQPSSKQFDKTMNNSFYSVHIDDQQLFRSQDVSSAHQSGAASMMKPCEKATNMRVPAELLEAQQRYLIPAKFEQSFQTMRTFDKTHVKWKSLKLLSGHQQARLAADQNSFSGSKVRTNINSRVCLDDYTDSIKKLRQKKSFLERRETQLDYVHSCRMAEVKDRADEAFLSQNNNIVTQRSDDNDNDNDQILEEKIKHELQKLDKQNEGEEFLSDLKNQGTELAKQTIEEAKQTASNIRTQEFITGTRDLNLQIAEDKRREESENEYAEQSFLSDQISASVSSPSSGGSIDRDCFPKKAQIEADLEKSFLIRMNQKASAESAAAPTDRSSKKSKLTKQDVMSYGQRLTRLTDEIYHPNRLNQASKELTSIPADDSSSSSEDLAAIAESKAKELREQEFRRLISLVNPFETFTRKRIPLDELPKQPRQSKKDVLQHLLQQFLSNEQMAELQMSILRQGEMQPGKEGEKSTVNRNFSTQSRNAEGVLKSLKFKEIFRKQFDAVGFEKVYKDDPIFLYQKKVYEEKDSMLPLVNKVREGRLILKDYTLNSGHCSAMANVWRDTGHPDVKVAYLENCGIDDEEFSLLIEGFVALKGLQQLFYKENVFGQDALNALQPLLLKSFPNNLQTLKLVKVHTSEIYTSELLKFLAEESPQLSSLSLVQMKLEPCQMQQIVNFLQNIELLQELDLSWNNFRPLDFQLLMDTLQENKQLRCLNLSWNLIINTKDQFQKSAYTYPVRGDHFFKRQDFEMTPSEKIAHRFRILIRFNKKLQHIDLTNTGLNEVFLFDMLPGLSRAKSLLSFHLGANPGINSRIQQFYRDKLKCWDHEVAPAIQVKKETNTYKKLLADPESKQKLNQLSKQTLALIEERSLFAESHLLKETFQMNQVNERLVCTKLSEVTVKTSGSDISISRVLGLKADIPGSGRWRMQTNNDEQLCWLCNSTVYCILFWNPQIGIYHEKHSPQIEQVEKARVGRLLRQHNSESFMEDIDVPVLFSNCTNWGAKPFKNLGLALRELGGEVPDFEMQAKKALEMQSPFRHETNPTKKTQKEMHEWQQNHLVQLKAKYYGEQWAKRKELLTKNSVFKQPTLINYEMATNPEQTYIVPLLIKPGTTHFFVRDAARQSLLSLNEPILTEKDFRFYYNRQVIQISDEPVPEFTKQLNRTLASDMFDKSKSVFKAWAEDTDQTVENCLKHDFKYWKVKKLIKDQADYQKVIQIFRTHFLAIKSVFLQIVGVGGTPPDIKQKEFQVFCAASGIIDKVTTVQSLDIYFQATNFEETEQDGNDDRALIRFEFMEILVRIVKGKYIDTKKHQSVSDGLEELIQKHILTQVDSFGYSWQKFRDEELWTFTINELFEANLGMLETLYGKLTKMKVNGVTPSRSTKFLSASSLIANIQDKAPTLQVSYRQLNQAFFRSKMTVALENEKAEEYQIVRFVEFLEFIARLAYLKFLETPQHSVMSLSSKILSLLETLFKLIGQSPISIADDNQLLSDSDDDY